MDRGSGTDFKGNSAVVSGAGEVHDDGMDKDKQQVRGFIAFDHGVHTDGGNGIMAAK